MYGFNETCTDCDFLGTRNYVSIDLRRDLVYACAAAEASDTSFNARPKIESGTHSCTPLMGG